MPNAHPMHCPVNAHGSRLSLFLHCCHYCTKVPKSYGTSVCYNVHTPGIPRMSQGWEQSGLPGSVLVDVCQDVFPM